MLGKLNLFRLTGPVTPVLLMWKWIGMFLRKKSYFKILGLPFSSKLDWSCSVISIVKQPPRKFESWFVLWIFFPYEIALYLYKSTIWPCMECCCHVLVDAPSCSLEMLDKFHKRICMTVGRSLDAFLEPLSHCRNVASLSLFYRYIWKIFI